MGKTKGKRTRRILLTAIENGILVNWISARDLVIEIQNGYGVSKGTRGYEGGNKKRDTRLTVMEVATNLGILYRKGLVQMKRPREGVTALWRAEPEP